MTAPYWSQALPEFQVWARAAATRDVARRLGIGTLHGSCQQRLIMFALAGAYPETPTLTQISKVVDIGLSTVRRHALNLVRAGVLERVDRQDERYRWIIEGTDRTGDTKP